MSLYHIHCPPKGEELKLEGERTMHIVLTRFSEAEALCEARTIRRRRLCQGLLTFDVVVTRDGKEILTIERSRGEGK